MSDRMQGLIRQALPGDGRRDGSVLRGPQPDTAHVSQQATATTSGWEDWDNDGNPDTR